MEAARRSLVFQIAPPDGAAERLTVGDHPVLPKCMPKTSSTPAS
jgi:hypothetical protein